MDSLFSLAHRLLTYGLDGSPIYVDEFTRLNRDVYEQALELYGTRGKTAEAEAELCLGLWQLLPLLFTITGKSSNTFSRCWIVVGKFFPNCLHRYSKSGFLSIAIAKFMMKNWQDKLMTLLTLGIRLN